MIRPNCRLQFTPEDLNFIAAVLGGGDTDAQLTSLFSDPESLDLILDKGDILTKILEDPGCLDISDHLYFYILVRHVLKRSEIDNTVLTEYIAELLSEYARAERSRNPAVAEHTSIHYLTDVIQALEKADDRMRFFIRVFIGNYTLFLSGLFPGYLNHRTRYKSAPDIEYYERLGKSHYRIASTHQLAYKYELSTILADLSSYYHRIRLALNDLSKRLVFLEAPGY